MRLSIAAPSRLPGRSSARLCPSRNINHRCAASAAGVARSRSSCHAGDDSFNAEIARPANSHVRADADWIRSTCYAPRKVLTRFPGIVAPSPAHRIVPPEIS